MFKVIQEVLLQKVLRSYIGRMNYSAYDKYLLEFSFRVDGSSKFIKGHQYGFFPTVAVGWRFTEEEFLKKYLSSWLSSGNFVLLGENWVTIQE